MNWLKLNYDRAILGLLAAILLAVSIYFLLQSRSFSERKEFTEIVPIVNGSAPRKEKIEPLDMSMLQAASAELADPAIWERQSNPNLFKSALYILRQTGGGDGELVPVTIEDNMFTEVPNKWILEYNLPLDDIQLLSRDMDNDGFTVLEEYRGGTNPIDAASRPPLWTKIRMKQYQEIPFRLIFRSRMGETITMDTLDLQQPTMFLRQGDSIPGTTFMVKEINVREEKHPELEMMVDASTVVVKDTKTELLMTLPLGKVVNKPDSFVVLTSLLEPGDYKLVKGQSFALKREPDLQYKLIDMSPAKAVIQNSKTQEILEVLPPQPGELEPVIVPADPDPTQETPSN